MVMIPPSVYVNGERADGAYIVMPIKITHGRSSISSQPDAPSANLVWESMEFAPEIGDRIQIDTHLPYPVQAYDSPDVLYDDPEVTYNGLVLKDPITRFVGKVSDRNVEEYAGLPAGVSITAINMQSELGKIKVLLPARPVENDVARVQAIAAAAGVQILIRGNPGPNLIATDIDSDAQSAIHEICNSSGGLLWVDGPGNLIYGTADHRADAPPIVALDSYAILSGLTWKSTVKEIINKVTIKWGPQEAEGSHEMSNQASIDVHGEQWEEVTTLLAEQLDAEYLGTIIIARRSWPFSQIDDVMIDSLYVDDEEYTVRASMILQVSDAVFLPIPPDPSPAGLMAEWIVEGWTEEWPANDRVSYQFAVSDRARFALTMLRAWSDALPNTWQEELDRGAWLNALIKDTGALV